MLLFSMLYLISSCGTLNKGMSSSEYYNYLREDTVICKLPAFDVEPSFESVLDSVIKAWKECLVCKEDPHPFIFEIEEILQKDILYYTIKINASPKMAHSLYEGAFNHEGYVFVVLKRSEIKSSFVHNDKKELTKLYFCDRIHSTKCGLIVKCKMVNENYDITNVDCQEAEIIKIK